MALRSSTPSTPVISGVHPRGRPGMAVVGLVLLLGGLASLGLAAQGALPLPAVNAPSLAITNPLAPTATVGIAPNGSAPQSFSPYYDPAHQFALYVSSSWSGKAGTIPINGHAQPATVFAPTSAALPRWRIALLPGAFPSTGLAYTNALNTIITAEGGKNVTPIQGPLAEDDGLYTWSRLDVIAQLKSGVQAHIVAYVQARPSGKTVLIIAEESNIMFNATDKQDFTPMINSLFLKV